MLFRSSSVQWRRFTPLHLTLGVIHFDLRLVWRYSAMETHFVKLFMCSLLADVASRGNLELFSECFNRSAETHREDTGTESLFIPLSLSTPER